MTRASLTSEVRFTRECFWKVREYERSHARVYRECEHYNSRVHREYERYIHVQLVYLSVAINTLGGGGGGGGRE